MSEQINNSRLETFCDGIFAIAITLLILEIKIPEISSIHSNYELRNELLSLWPSWFAFLLTFTILLIAWVNHHHMATLLSKTSSSFIYANGLLLLTVVVFPFSTSLLGGFLGTEFSTLPIVLYCFTNLIHASAWFLVFSLATKPKDLTKNPVTRQSILNTQQVIGYTVLFNIAITVLAFWLPLIALGLTTTAWIFYLFAGIRYTPLD